MSVRVQVLLDLGEKERLLQQARADRLSLSAFIRLAALAYAAQRDASSRRMNSASLRDFFDECDRLVEIQQEPDWQEHRRVIETSIARGQSER